MGSNKVVTPRQAMLISLGGIGVGAIGVAVACLFFEVPFTEAMLWYAVMAFFTLAFPWVSLDLKTRNRAVRAHNFFVYFFIVLLLVVLIAQLITGTRPFPKWAIGLLIGVGVACYSVMAYYAVANFLRWLRGDLIGNRKT